MNNAFDMMSKEKLLSKIAEYEKKHSNVAISYGGDGTVLDVVKKTKGKKAVIPVRNYGLCEIHQHYLADILDGKHENGLKQTLCPFIEYDYAFGIFKGKGIAEVTIKNEDPTSALRFNLYVDEKLYMKNVIADGIIISTAYGSTGYFKSVARCIFNTDAIGVAFIAPTQGINNLIISNKSQLRIEFIRSANVIATADKDKKHLEISAEESINVKQLADQVAIFGLNEFHCQECRTLRHSIVEDGVKVQDQYAI